MPRFRSAVPLAFTVLTALCVLAWTGAARSDSPNLLINPGFEQDLPGNSWMPAGWDTSDSGLPTAFFGRDTLSVHGGHYAVSVANASNRIPLAQNWNQSVLVDPQHWNQDVVLSIWTRSLGVEGRAYVMIQAFSDTISKMAKTWNLPRDAAAKRLRINRIDDPLFDLGWKREVFTEEETPWTLRQVRVHVAPGTNILFVRCGVIGTGQVILDDASLTFEAAAPAPDVPVGKNLLEDPDFEGNLHAWEISQPPYPDIVVERDSTQVHSGRYSIVMTSDKASAMVGGRSGVSQVLCNRNLGGKRVRFVAWLRCDSLKSLAYAKIYAHTVHGVFQEVTANAISSTLPWTRTTVEMDLPSDTYAVWSVVAYTAPASGVLRVDDTRLEVLGPARGSATPASTGTDSR